MSLLMDALRKAEQQKQASLAQEKPGRDAASARLELEPLVVQPKSGAMGKGPVPAAGTSRLPELPRRLEELDEQFVTSAARTPQPKRPAPPPAEPGAAPSDSSTDTARAAARAIFEAKHPAPKENRSFAIAVGLLTLVASISIGGYFWWQMQPKEIDGTLLANEVRKPPTEPGTAPAAVTLASFAAGPAQAAQGTAPTDAPPPAANQALVATPVNPGHDNLPARSKRDVPSRLEQSPAPTPAVARQNDPIQVTTAPLKLNPILEQAFQAFQRGDINHAQAAWQKVLESDSRNADALYGMAAVALHQRQPNQAADFYLRALEANPRDALALSGLLSLKGHVDPQQTESRLKNLLAEQADSPFLNFALGNLYAKSTRWAEAQQAFFKAHVADPGNPDYLFNLAVSLDQLHQSRLAVQYYNQALAAAAQRQPGFDAVQVAVRLKVLQSSQ